MANNLQHRMYLAIRDFKAFKIILKLIEASILKKSHNTCYLHLVISDFSPVKHKDKLNASSNSKKM